MKFGDCAEAADRRGLSRKPRASIGAGSMRGSETRREVASQNGNHVSGTCEGTPA